MIIHWSFQVQDLPPPYAYAATLKVEIGQDLRAHYQREYLGREELTTTEIEAEGFTTDDDFEWKGHLDAAWQEDVLWFQGCQLISKADVAAYLHIDRKIQQGFPNDIEKASYLFESIQQGILEQADREAPLVVKLRNEQKKVAELKWSFANRSYQINQQTQSWDKGMEALQMIYSQDLQHSASKSQTAIKFDSEWIALQPEVIRQLVK